jgi:hypothetical protein
MGGKFRESILIVYGRSEILFPANDNEDWSDAVSTIFSRPRSLSCQS